MLFRWLGWKRSSLCIVERPKRGMTVDWQASYRMPVGKADIVLHRGDVFCPKLPYLFLALAALSMCNWAASVLGSSSR